MTPATTDLDPVVARGAALLDERGPANWRELVDAATLSQRSTNLCVVGQAFGSLFDAGELVGDNAWHAGLRQLGAPSSFDLGRRPWLAEHGFDVDYNNVIFLDDAFDRLTAAWRRHLARERQEVS